MTDLRALLGDQCDDVIERARLAIEDELIELRDARIGVLNRNGLTINEKDGSVSEIRRMSTAGAVWQTLATVLPELLERAWEEGYQASVSVIATGDLASNPYREDPR